MTRKKRQPPALPKSLDYNCDTEALVDSRGRTAAVACDDNPEFGYRLAEAWNAVHGIPTEALEAGVVGDLLAACKAVLGYAADFVCCYTCGYEEGHEPGCPVPAVRAALAKAEGRTP